jgi:twitching motility two-component system response regulator PilH
MSAVEGRFPEKAMPLILIVEDSPTELFQMTKALEKGGFRVEGAADGEEALRKARDMRPDLILMDIVMPGMDGFRATRALSNDPATKSIPVIMVSSKDQESDRVWGMRQGAVDFIVKPVKPALLLEKAQAALMAG